MINAALPTRRQSGAFLLEAMIAILIFSFGVLGIVGLQARSLKAVGDAQYRGEAAYFAQTLAGRMWAHDPSDVATYFGSGGTGFTDWSAQLTDASSGLPGASTIPPTVEFLSDSDHAVNSANGVMVRVTIYWQVPGDERECNGDTSDPTCYHRYVTSIVVGSNVTT